MSKQDSFTEKPFLLLKDKKGWIQSVSSKIEIFVSWGKKVSFILQQHMTEKLRMGVQFTRQSWPSIIVSVNVWSLSVICQSILNAFHKISTTTSIMETYCIAKVVKYKPFLHI